MSKKGTNPIYANLGPHSRRLSVPCTHDEYDALYDLARDRDFLHGDTGPGELVRVLIREALARAGKMPMDGVKAHDTAISPVQIGDRKFFELHSLYEIKLSDLRDSAENTYMIAAVRFDEAVSATKEYFSDIEDGMLDVVGVMELGALAFVVIEE